MGWLRTRLFSDTVCCSLWPSKSEFDGCHSSYLRLNHYPPCPKLRAGSDTSRSDASVWDDSSGEIDPWSISHHTDAGAVTVLHQTQVQSLQVFQKSDGRWCVISQKDFSKRSLKTISGGNLTCAFFACFVGA
jgi:hypothetical protein